MGFLSEIKHWCLARMKLWRQRRNPMAIKDRDVNSDPLREFVYLDEVSLVSLLSSQKGEITNSTFEEEVNSSERGGGFTLGANISDIGKAEVNTQFQTRNSNTQHTAKKAIAQSWFRELDKLQQFRLIETVQQVKPLQSVDQIPAIDNCSVSILAASLKRGATVEFKARLSAHPIFRLVTLVSEFQGMAKDFPKMMAEAGGVEALGEIDGIAKVMQRLLVGLVPIRAQVLDYVVIQVEGIDYIVHNDAVSALDVKTKPLEIVCVTELSAYWKDIRRVIFSDAEFTILCRISSTGLQDKWAPAKLTDLINGVAPNFSEQMDEAMAYFDNNNKPFKPKPKATSENNLNAALLEFKEAFLVDIGESFNDQQLADFDIFFEKLEYNECSPASQRQAFDDLESYLSDMFGHQISKEKALKFREASRAATGLEYLGKPTNSRLPTPQAKNLKQQDQYMLDVEAIAIYW